MTMEPTRTGLATDTLERAIVDNLIALQGRYPEAATPNDWYHALAYTVRDRMLARDQYDENVRGLRRKGGVLPVRRVSDRTSAGQQPALLGHPRQRTKGAESARPSVASAGTKRGS